MNNVVKNSKTSPKKSVTAKQLAKSNLTKRKNPDWDNLDRGYRYLTLDMKLPHDLAVAVMGNVVEESLGDYKAALKNGGGRGLIQWDGRKAPSGRYNLWGSIWASVAKPANVYDSTTDTVKNYWAPWGGLKGDKVRLKFIKAPLKEKARIYAESYLRPGKPRIADRQLSAMQLDSIYNPRIKNIIVLKDGGQIRKMQTAAGGPLNLSPKDIKRGANLIGEYFLKGLGAFGKIATAPFRSQGPTSATIYKSKELLAKERTIENKSEELLGKAMTWVSPLNYGTALATGNGLNARKGEEEVASWSPAWLALGRAAELYAGPKAVKGVKAAPKAVVNTAAKAGVKPAKAVVVAREINLATKNRPNLSNRTISSERYVNGTTGTPEVQYTLYNEFGEPIGQTKIGATTVGRIERTGARKLDRMVDGVYSKNKAHKVSEDTYNVAVQDIIDNGGTGLESGWSLMMPLKTLPVTNKFPHVVIGLEFGNPVRLLTGRTSRPLPQKVKGNHYLEIKPKTEIKFNEITGDFEEVPIKELVKEPKGLTSLKFFERKPSRISEAERAGVPKGERNLPFKSKLPTEHVQGDEAVKMFKEYGGEPIPEGSINGELLRKYVAEARERYGLKNNKNITDEEIAQALYKHSKELGGNTTAVNAQGEPQLLFRGDTRRYTQLKERMSPEELATKSGTMDNSLGNLFLGELPGTAGKHTRGLERYLVTGNEFLEKRLEGSGTGSRAVMPDGTFATEWGSTISEFPEGSYHLVTYNTKHGPNTYYKLPSSYSESGVNDINAFVVRTPQVRDASREISVLNDDFMVKGGPKVEYHGPIRREVLDKDGFPLIVDEKGNVVADGLAGSSDRQAMALHYRYVLNDAKNKKQGLLKSNGETDGTPGNYLRDEHGDYTYFALPNFNIQGAKHLLPYDLRIPRNWKDKNIYRGLIPLTTGYTLYNIFNQPLQQLQYLKQGGKMNLIDFLKNGSGIHIKEENKGKFTSYCGGKVTNECILKGKNSSNPAIRKRATFAANARKWKHEDGGELIKKHLEGAKLTFGLKLGNFANSDLGKSVISNGLSFLLDKLFNKSASSNLEIALAALEKELPTIDPMQVAQMIEIARNQYADPENPNANGGDIFNSYIKNQITAPILARQLEEHKKRLAAIDLLKNQAKSSAVGTFFNTLAQGGIEYLLNKYGTTEKADS